MGAEVKELQANLGRDGGQRGQLRGQPAALCIKVQNLFF